MPNVAEYINDPTVKKGLYRIPENRVQDAKFDISHGYEAMAEKQKMYLYDLERQIER